MGGFPEDDGIVCDLRSIEHGARLASFRRGEAIEFLKIVAAHDRLLAHRIEARFLGEIPPWRYDATRGEEAIMRDALEDAPDLRHPYDDLLERLRFWA